MAFFEKISRIFGFGPDTDAEYESADQPTDKAQAEAAQQIAASRIEPTIDAEKAHAIFDHVVGVFNGALPEFIAKSVDPEKQKEQLYESLDASLKEYLEAIKRDATAACDAAWGQERDRLKAEANELRKKAQELEEKRSELNDRQLSADRQKRALNERVRDLEAQVLNLEAEREQLEIENKCMLNKAKAAAVLEGDQDIASKITELDDKLTDSHKENDALKTRIATLEEEKAKLEDAVESAKVKGDLSKAMDSDFQRIAAEATQQAKDASQKVAELTAESEKTQSIIDDLKKEIAGKDAIIESLQEDVKSKEEALNESVTEEELASLVNQISRFEDVKARMNAHISTLKENLKASQAENESLRNTIKNNLLEHAEAQNKLMLEINRLNESLGADGNSEANNAPRKAHEKRSEPKQSSDIEDLISGADWLVATPPKPTSMRPSDDNDSFGYQPPQKKNRTIHNDAQLSLFD